MGEKGILLTLIKAMDLINKQNRLLAVLGHVLLGLFNRFANLFDTSQYRRDGNELTIKGFCGETG